MKGGDQLIFLLGHKPEVSLDNQLPFGCHLESGELASGDQLLLTYKCA